ncbi:MAG: hypothetical protein ACFFKA_16610 [Candidatus Thorarchaeota archaeon]
MLKSIKKEIYTFSDEDKEKMAWAEWAWQSHYWIETYPNYYECKLCKTRHNGMQGIGFETARLCPENPIFKKEIAMRGFKNE